MMSKAGETAGKAAAEAANRAAHGLAAGIHAGSKSGTQEQGHASDTPQPPAGELETVSHPSTKDMLTAKQLQSICNIHDSKARELAALVNELGPKYGINTPLRLAHFLAQCAHESACFSTKAESLNYSVDGLIATFSYYRKNPSKARVHGRTAQYPAKQELIANTVYDDANRAAGYKLGNIQPGDGWRFRGGGDIQITGRNMYTAYAKHVGVAVGEVAEFVRSTERWAMDSAMWVFAVEKALLDEADRDDVLTITKRINGGLNGLEDRKAKLQKAKRALGI